MAANINPIFVKEARLESVRLTSANTARDGSGVVETLFTAGPDGSRVDSINSIVSGATGLSSLNQVRVFIRKNNTLPWRLLQEIAVASLTSSNTASGAFNSVVFAGGLNLPAGSEIGVIMTVAANAQDQIDVHARGGDY
jgi:hypothetical protein